ncbi:TlpA disulfide reductase family protein [uncultured Chitinophaga sp.]|uniref:TlpA disulfide reductase family protein n=1 Tax=uncultured Chitinophaga sp. TaxID=339340 RepID=UPI0025CBC1F9|nr:TlpA disulfide reductase family protein [uncultured Chitinophaga sp.]
MKKILSLAVLTAGLWSCKSSAPALQNGAWQARLHRADGANIVFNFEVTDSAEKKVLHIINAKERLLVDSIRQEGDSVFIRMPFFDSEFKTALQPDGSLKGQWIRHLAKEDVAIEFSAEPGKRERFSAPASSQLNISGRWPAYFTSPEGRDSSFAIGEFSQQGSRVTGTFLTSTGDYRFLEGVIAGDTLKLSTFDGSHAYLLTAKVENDSTISNGIFYAGISGREIWTARKDDRAALPDERSLTTVKPDSTRLDFRFPDINGNQVSIRDDRFKGKVVIVQLAGSWCPNCMDETAYLSEWYRKNKDRGVEIVALAYERTTDEERSRRGALSFIKRFNLEYPVLLTGVTPSDKERTEKTLPQLTPVKGFPTTIFLDKTGKVREVHTGFNGPGTGVHYEEFQQNFNRLVDQLLAEKSPEGIL